MYHLANGQRTRLATVGNAEINFSMSPTRQLALLMMDGSTDRLLSLDDQFSRQLDSGSPYLPGDVKWSPDGETVAFNQGSSDGNHDLVTIFDSDGNLMRTFATHVGILEDGNGLAWTRCNS